MKKILIALPNDSLGGAELYLKNIASYFVSKDYEITVLFLKQSTAFGWANFEEKKNINLVFTKSTSELRGVFLFLVNLLKLRKNRYNYIFTSHVHLTGIIGFFIKLKIIKTKYFIGRESTSIFKRFKGIRLFIFKAFYRLGYKSLDLLICQTSFMKSQLLEGLPWLKNKINIKVIPNPVNFININPNEKVSLCNNYIVSAGRLIDEKGFDILIQSFSIVKRNKPNLNLIILGEGNMREKLDELIINYKLKDSVYLPGFVDNVYPYFKNAKACIVSSRVEGFPNVLLQMMSQNNNVVSTLCAGDINKLKGVVTVQVNNKDLLAEAILKVLNSDNSANRNLFDTELNNRSLESFISKINEEL